MNTRHDARRLALQYLYTYQFRKENGYEEDTEFPCKDEDELQELGEDTILYATHLARGVIEHMDDLDAIIERYSLHRTVKKIGNINKNILRLSIFSLLYTKEIHSSIIIDEAVKLSIEFSDDVTYKFVNGILDAIKKQEL